MFVCCGSVRVTGITEAEDVVMAFQTFENGVCLTAETHRFDFADFFFFYIKGAYAIPVRGDRDFVSYHQTLEDAQNALTIIMLCHKVVVKAYECSLFFFYISKCISALTRHRKSGAAPP